MRRNLLHDTGCKLAVGAVLAMVPLTAVWADTWTNVYDNLRPEHFMNQASATSDSSQSWSESMRHYHERGAMGPMRSDTGADTQAAGQRDEDLRPRVITNPNDSSPNNY